MPDYKWFICDCGAKNYFIECRPCKHFGYYNEGSFACTNCGMCICGGDTLKEYTDKVNRKVKEGEYSQDPKNTGRDLDWICLGDRVGTDKLDIEPICDMCQSFTFVAHARVALGEFQFRFCRKCSPIILRDLENWLVRRQQDTRPPGGFRT